MPVKECRRRKKNERPCPARSGATPPRIVTGVVVLGDDAATTLPCRLGDDQRTHHYLGRQEKKSRKAPESRSPDKRFSGITEGLASTNLAASPGSRVANL